MNPTKAERTSETAPLRSVGRSNSIVAIHTTGKTVSTTFFLVSTLILSIIPIIQVSIGATYNGECPIDQRIPTYMIVASSVGLVVVALLLFTIFTFRCLISDTETLTVLATCGVFCNILLIILLSIFSLIWFIIGCVWVFSVSDDVQFKFPLKSDYCNPVLYKSAFALLILTIIGFTLHCCVTCFRVCCTGSND